MIILDTFTGWHSWQANLCDFVIIISAIFSAVVVALNGKKSITRLPPVIALIISICFFILAIVGEVTTSETCYRVYLTDMSLDEFEAEYDVIDIDGLILEAYKKK